MKKKNSSCLNTEARKNVKMPLQYHRFNMLNDGQKYLNIKDPNTIYFIFVS